MLFKNHCIDERNSTLGPWTLIAFYWGYQKVSRQRSSKSLVLDSKIQPSRVVSHKKQ